MLFMSRSLLIFFSTLCCTGFFNPNLTGAGEFVAHAADLEVDSATSLRVLTSAQIGHALRTFLVHVHVTCCKQGENIELVGDKVK